MGIPFAPRAVPLRGTRVPTLEPSPGVNPLGPTLAIRVIPLFRERASLANLAREAPSFLVPTRPWQRDWIVSGARRRQASAEPSSLKRS